MTRLFRATAVPIVLLAACGEKASQIVDPLPAPAANHVPGEAPTVHSVGVQVNGNIATVIWHADPFNMGENYTVEVFAGASCTGTNLVTGSANVAGTTWTQPLHLYLNVGPLAPGDHCARVKSNGTFSPPSFRTFIAATFSIGSTNSPPEAGFDAPADALEGEAVEFAGVAEDPDGDPLAFEWLIDGKQASGALAFDHVFEDNGQYEVTFTVADGKGGTSTMTRTIDVRNVPPSMASAAAMAGTAIPAGTPFEIAGVFSDPGMLDTHSLALDCNDGGTPMEGAKLIAVQPDYSGACTWLSAGTYRLRLTIADDDGGADSRVSDPVVVYVAGEGHVTGGGWIHSPAGACQLTPACSAVTGRGSFGFTSKYMGRSAVPTGNVTFQFASGVLTFKATAQLWLSVSGSVARIGGVGTVNGEGEYDFLLTAVDGGTDAGADGVRLWIRDRANGVVVYDSRPGTDPWADETTELSGGSIVIHAGE